MPPSLRYEPGEALSGDEWLEFAARNPEANVFHHPAWTGALASCYGFRPFLLTLRAADGHLRAGLPVMFVPKALQGKRWIALPFTDHCAPLTADEEAARQFAELIELAGENGRAAELELRFPLASARPEQYSSSHVLHILRLEPDPQRVYIRLNSAHRRNIRAAQNHQVRIERSTDPDSLRQYYRLHLLTRQRQGMPAQPWQFFEQLGKRLLEPGLGFVMLAYAGDRLLAGAVYLHWAKTLTYKFGASSADDLPLRPNNLLMWEAIRWGCEQGYTRLDLGRTDLENSGLRRYKSGWGAAETPLVYTVLSAHPQPTHESKLMNLMQFVIRRSPAWVCRAAGEILYRYAA